MVNPSFPDNQMVGVFNLELLRLYGYLYQDTDKNYAIVHALDGYDEISLTGDTKVISNNYEEIFSPEDLDVEPITPEAISAAIGPGAIVQNLALVTLGNIIGGAGGVALTYRLAYGPAKPAP